MAQEARKPGDRYKKKQRRYRHPAKTSHKRRRKKNVALEITTHPQVEINKDGEQMYTISCPEFGLNGKQVASIVLRVFVPGKTKLAAES